MGKRKNPKKNPHKHSLPLEVVTQRLERKRSGAHGVHADQKTRVLGIALTNRVGARSSATRAAVKDSLRSNSRGEFSFNGNSQFSIKNRLTCTKIKIVR